MKKFRTLIYFFIFILFFMKFVYLFHVEGTNVYKIGNSKHPDKRLKEVQTACPFRVTEVMRFESKFPTKIESALHRKYGFQKEDEDGRELQGEFFALSISDQKIIKEQCKTMEDNFLLLEKVNTYVQEKGD